MRRSSVVRAALILAIVCVVLIAGGFVAGCAPQRNVDVVRVEQQLRSLLELHTYEHIYRDVVYFGEERRFLGIRTVDRAVLFAIDIRVRAGINLEEGFALTRDRSSRDRIYVRMPEAEVLGVDADEGSIHEYFIREQGGRINLMELTGQLDEVKERTRQDAVDRGLLGQAEENARAIIRRFLQLAGYTDVVFSTVVTDEEIQG